MKKIREIPPYILLASVLLSLGLTSIPSQAEVIIVNPSRGGGLETNAPMIHADIVYDAAKKELRAQVDTNYARPRMRALPSGYSFNMETKYRVMSGKSYNFQYAWNPGAAFAPPPGGAFWIECLQTTPGLETYDGPGNKTENPPRPYTPIFGTSGSPRTWKWYGRMAHNTYTLRNPITNVVSAEYRIFIGNAETGARDDFAGYPETTVTLTWDIDPPVFVSPHLAGGQLSGDMIHIDVSFDESANRIVAHVDDTQPTPLLAPLAAGQAFEPEKKYAVLNQKGYNAQYGWNIGEFFTLPPGSAIWIEQVGASPGLEVYESSGVNGGYAPIFGTAGSAPKWKWSGFMVHNTYAVLNPFRSMYVADYRVFVGDAQTGSRDAFSDIGETQLRLLWQTLPCALPPELKIENLACRSGCATARFNGEYGRPFFLERTAEPGSSARWQRVAGPLMGANALQEIMDVSATNRVGFYRMVSEEAL